MNEEFVYHTCYNGVNADLSTQCLLDVKFKDKRFQAEPIHLSFGHSLSRDDIDFHIERLKYFFQRGLIGGNIIYQTDYKGWSVKQNDYDELYYEYKESENNIIRKIVGCDKIINEDMVYVIDTHIYNFENEFEDDEPYPFWKPFIILHIETEECEFQYAMRFIIKMDFSQDPHVIQPSLYISTATYINKYSIFEIIDSVRDFLIHGNIHEEINTYLEYKGWKFWQSDTGMVYFEASIHESTSKRFMAYNKCKLDESIAQAYIETFTQF